MGQQWTSLLAKNGLPTSATLNSIQQQPADQLSKLSGAEFDRAYMSAMVADHEQDAGTLQRISGDAQSGEVKQLAATGLTTTQQHLTGARAAPTRSNATTAVATPAEPPRPPRTVGSGAAQVAAQGDGPMGGTRRSRLPTHPGDPAGPDGPEAREEQEGQEFADRMARRFPKVAERWTDLASRHGSVKVNPNMGRRRRRSSGWKGVQRQQHQVYVDIVVETSGPRCHTWRRKAARSGRRNSERGEQRTAERSAEAERRAAAGPSARGEGEEEERGSRCRVRSSAARSSGALLVTLSEARTF